MGHGGVDFGCAERARQDRENAEDSSDGFSEDSANGEDVESLLEDDSDDEGYTLLDSKTRECDLSGEPPCAP